MQLTEQPKCTGGLPCYPMTLIRELGSGPVISTRTFRFIWQLLNMFFCVHTGKPDLKTVKSMS